eukprot:scaffold12331_cov31-Tisochrysis_lutea.AAC.4
MPERRSVFGAPLQSVTERKVADSGRVVSFVSRTPCMIRRSNLASNRWVADAAGATDSAHAIRMPFRLCDPHISCATSPGTVVKPSPAVGPLAQIAPG